MRGKHGFVKALHGNNNSGGETLYNHPASKEARSAQFKTYVQSRRLRLRQRGSGLPPHHLHHYQQHDVRLQDSSDMSLDESEVQDEDDGNDNGYDSEARDHVLDLDSEQYRSYMWELEQRLLERTESAAKSRLSFLMERRLSAGERLHHVQKVVQQQRTEQELRQHKVRDELEQKMVRAMARRNAYLEAAIENDPSRRFRRRSASQTSSASPAVTSTSAKAKATRAGLATAPTTTASGAMTASTAPSTGSLTTAPKRSTLYPSSKGVSSSMVRSKLKRDLVKSSKDRDNNKYTSEIRGDDYRLHGQEQASPKNSPLDMTQSKKAHLTSMTSVSSSFTSPSSSSSPSPSSLVTMSPLSVGNVERGGGGTGRTGATPTFQDISKEVGVRIEVSSTTYTGGKTRLERMTLWAQRRIRQRLVEKASREYMRAIGGSHQRVLGLKFEELARLLHTNKALIQATVKLLRYSSQLAQMDRSICEQQQSMMMMIMMKKNPARVFLSMYMVLAHPSQIRSPAEHAHPAHVEDDSAFESLVESSKALLEALQTWLSANTKHVDNINTNNTTLPASAPTKATIEPTPSFPIQEDDTSSLLNFDAAWTSYYNFFEAWKDKDAQRLLNTLLDHAQQIESIWRTVQSDPTARAEWGPRIEEQRRDLRDKARQLAGPNGVARLDEVFADFVTATTPPTLPPTTTAITAPSPAITATSTVTSDAVTPMETDTETMVPAPLPETAESSSSAPVEPTTTTPATKKRQRLVSVSNPDTAMDVDGQPSTGPHVVPPTISATADGPSANTDDPVSTGEEPQPKKPFKARGPRQPVAPAGFEKQDKWSNLQLIHELALDPNFKIESKRVGGDLTSSNDAEEGTSNSSNGNANSIESLESRIRAMATKAYFDKIREDAEQGQLGKWIPPLLTTIREQLLDMVPQESSVARQIRDGFDLEFVQQQVDRKVYDVKGALEGVLGLMAKLCAPVRDPAIRQIQQDLSLITGNPLQQSPQAASANRPTASATSATPKDLVSVLKDILELLEEMLMDLANYRLMVARPSLEKQAIPYEQHAFKTALENGEITLDATTAWLEASAASLSRASAVPTATTSSGSKDQPSTISSSSSTSSSKTNRHYEVYVNAVLDLLYSKTPLELSSKDEFPETFVLDQARLTRYQNELQALALIAVMWNISLNVQPPLRDEGQQELKQTLFRLMESADTSKEALAEAIIEAKEKTLLLTSRPSSSSSTSTRSTSATTPPTTSLLLSADQKSYLRNTIERAISFDSSLYSVLSQRIRKVLESYLLSSPPGLGSKPGVMPEQAELNKVGLGAMAKEIETFATQIGFLIRYNAKVYQPWYDPLLTKILPATTRKPRTPSAAATTKTSGPAPITSAPDEAAAASTTINKAAIPEVEPTEDDDDNKASKPASSPPA
ncbi:hypothetical protein BG015_009008 [Linnemannia schmuckeri]|uniref:Tcp11-domain-containing protein n=1 Tax=Linnemannia schmuckeri TaxID=64567 RepID=A0A9P5S5S3_9FUNG|nr:hypothetical protein BG015_009008 [Linnemannia schmuckeri]